MHVGYRLQSSPTKGTVRLFVVPHKGRLPLWGNRIGETPKCSASHPRAMPPPSLDVTTSSSSLSAELATARSLLASVEAAAVHLELEDCAAFEQALVGASERLRAALAVAGDKAAIAETRSGVTHPVRVSSRVSSMRLPGLTIEGISGVLIDLDGTMYNPRGLIPGAEDFFGFLCRRNIPFVLLSNTGAKGARGVQEKLLHLGHLHLRQELLPVSKILTAAEAQAAYMLDTCPAGAKIFAISGGSDPAFWMGLLRAEAGRKGCDPGLVDSWDIRTQASANL